MVKSILILFNNNNNNNFKNLAVPLQILCRVYLVLLLADFAFSQAPLAEVTEVVLWAHAFDEFRKTF